MTKHRGRSLGFADHADGHIALGEAGQCFLDMAGGLILGHHQLETVDRRSVVALFHVVAADGHFLAGELVARAFQLLLGGGGVFGIRILADHLFQRVHGLLGTALVAADVRDLVVVRGGDQVLRVGGVRRARMQADVTRSRTDRGVVVAPLISRVGRHQQRLARPGRIRVLTIDFLELLVRAFGVAVLETGEALIVELVRRLFDKSVVVLGEELVPDGAGAAATERGRQNHQSARKAEMAADPAAPARARKRLVALSDHHSRDDLNRPEPNCRSQIITIRLPGC